MFANHAVQTSQARRNLEQGGQSILLKIEAKLSPSLIHLITARPPSIRDRIHRNENFAEIIPVFFNFFQLFQKKNYKSHFM